MSFAKRLEGAIRANLPHTHTTTTTTIGHGGGREVEKLCETFLKDLKAVRTHVFLQAKLTELWNSGKFGTVAELMTFLRKHWWWKLNSRSEKRVKAAILHNRPLGEKQDDTADLVIEDAGKIRIVNVKSSNLDKDSMHPNIISASKVLTFFDWASSLPAAERNQTLADAEVYFLSVYWHEDGNKMQLEDVAAKRLTKLKVEKIPRLNFDAAMQIQWHVRDMEEIENQKALDFARELSLSVVEKFAAHAERKTRKFQKLAERLGNSTE